MEPKHTARYSESKQQGWEWLKQIIMLYFCLMITSIFFGGAHLDQKGVEDADMLNTVTTEALVCVDRDSDVGYLKFLRNGIHGGVKVSV
jgi:hypothetical protein